MAGMEGAVMMIWVVAIAAEVTEHYVYFSQQLALEHYDAAYESAQGSWGKPTLYAGELEPIERPTPPKGG